MNLYDIRTPGANHRVQLQHSDGTWHTLPYRLVTEAEAIELRDWFFKENPGREFRLHTAVEFQVESALS